MGCRVRYRPRLPASHTSSNLRVIVRMKIKTLIPTLIFLLYASAAFAAFDKKPEFRLEELYRYDKREDNHHLYTNRASAAFTYRDNKDKALFRLKPFFEIRRNIEKHFWERKEWGVEIGKDVFEWFYLGEAIQRVWYKEDFQERQVYKRGNDTESETRLLLSHKLISKLGGFFLNEYTYDFNKGAGIRNEAVLGLVMPLNKYLEAQIDWRHIDRIHFYDSDNFEAVVTLIF